MSKKVVFIIMDGWGEGKKDKADAIYQANTKYIKSLYYPENAAHAHLLTDGEHVGLPEGQMGNSEVGHLNIGAGRVVYQDLVKVNRAIKDGSIENNETITKAFEYAKKMAKEEGILVGISTGASLAAVAQKLQEIPASSKILTFNYDTGERYLSTALVE